MYQSLSSVKNYSPDYFVFLYNVWYFLSSAHSHQRRSIFVWQMLFVMSLSSCRIISTYRITFCISYIELNNKTIQNVLLPLTFNASPFSAIHIVSKQRFVKEISRQIGTKLQICFEMWHRATAYGLECLLIMKRNVTGFYIKKHYWRCN